MYELDIPHGGERTHSNLNHRSIEGVCDGCIDIHEVEEYNVCGHNAHDQECDPDREIDCATLNKKSERLLQAGSWCPRAKLLRDLASMAPYIG